MRSFYVFAALFLVQIGFANAQIPQIEREALIELYNSTDGANWNYNTNWRNVGDTDFNDPGTECTWDGVWCAAGTNVTALSLSDNHLSGSIPAELGNLSSLQALDLFCNFLLTGSIPPELGNLSNLTYMDLGYNRLTGDIPTELGSLSNLTHLDLCHNQLGGNIPAGLGSLSNLENLRLHQNHLSGSIPAELGNLSSLEQIYLGSNQLTGSIPPELANLSSLRGLYLSENQLSGIIPSELGSLSSLWELNLSENQLSGSIPPEMGNIPDLNGLFLNDNSLTGSIPPELGNYQALMILSLRANQLSGSIPSELRNLTILLSDYTDIGYNALWTDDPALLAFLDSKDPDWAETQTIAPTGVTAVRESSSAVSMSWAPIIYTVDSGGYRVSYATTSGGPHTFYDMTTSKTENSLIVDGLPRDTTLYFIVETQTNPHLDNQNTVISEPSAEVMVTTQAFPIPTLGTVGVIVFISMLLLAGVWSLRR